jgi:hypothetical protein
MRDPFSPRPDAFDMSRHARRHSSTTFIQVQKRLARRASRHGGAKRQIALGIEEARELRTDLAVGTIWCLTLALWLRQKAQAFYDSEAYYASFGETSLFPSWEDYLPWAIDEIEYA